MPSAVLVIPPPGVSHVLPPSHERWMTWPNHPLDCDAYRRFGSAGDPLMWEISQPAKCGPPTFQRPRLASAGRMNAPLPVPTTTRTPLMARSFHDPPAATRSPIGLSPP